MSQIKRSYRALRAEFKQECHHAMSKDKSLAMLIVETYTAWKHKKHIMEIWSMFGKNPEYEAFRRDYYRDLMGRHLSGRINIWRSFYFAEYPDLYRYKRKIPELLAMGDALAVAYAVLRKDEIQTKRGRIQ